jgi:hypothetical protein
MEYELTDIEIKEALSLLDDLQRLSIAEMVDIIEHETIWS